MPELHGWIFDDDLIAGEENYTPFLIWGYEGNDYLSGSNAGDLLDGGTGADDMYGWRGNDTYVVDNAGDYVEEAEFHYAYGDPSDLVYASISYTLPEFVENLSLIAGAGAINGTGNELENVIHGNESGNTLQGLDGEDLIIGHGGNDTLRGGNQNDELHGNDNNDTLEGGDGEDELFGGAHGDTLDGGAHDDQLDGGTGADTMRGGTGNDNYRVDNSGDELIEFSNQGIDTAYSTAGSFTLDLYVEHLVLENGAGAIDGTGNLQANTIVGNGSDNEIRGENGNDLLKGGGGADVLRGGLHNDDLHGEAGDDELRGDGGDDEMFGGTESDTYYVDSAGDIVFEYQNQGTDTVNVGGALANYTLTDNVENLTLLNVANGTGNALANRIVGNIIDNTIDGAGGIDTMEGRQGDDIYIVDNAADDVIELANQGDDTVRASVSYTLGAPDSVEHLETTNAAGTGTINLTGNDAAQSITGNNGANTLNGRGGSDVLDGLGGIDTASYLNNGARVVVVLGANGGPGFAYELNSQEVLVSVDTLFNIENVRGSNFADMLIGNEAINELRGGLSDDTYVVQNAGDVVTEFVAEGTDEVQTSVDYTLGVGTSVERLRTTDDDGTTPINLTGNNRANEITGNDGDNRIDGGFGAGTSDTLIGRDGSDIYIVRSANDTITENGGQGLDEVRATVSYRLTAGADVEILRTTNDLGTAAIALTGNASGNDIFGNNGNNTLNGGGGRDELTGGGGRDEFLFDTPLDPAVANVAGIQDFTRGTDLIVLENTVFNAFAAGALAEERFVTTPPQQANDNIIYDQATGALFYDSDGNGAAAAVQFAEVTPGLALSHEDFFIV